MLRKVVITAMVNGVIKNAGINVEKIEGLKDDFIMGMDISSYCSLIASGVKFRDYDGDILSDKGFFELLKNSGLNYIRIRVWNDPYDSEGRGYGGGNCDIENAKKIGKLATDAGMRILLNLHYSDFWADPQKQMAPKKWKEYTAKQKVEAIYEYTKDSIAYLRNNGVDIGMVQIGNETTNGLCDETDWACVCEMFKAGSKAVREIDKDILVGIHFTDPQNNRYDEHAYTLKENDVDYDVFLSSFYPLWHGTLENLSRQLKNVIDEYGKKVMLVETSFPYTLDEIDGHLNTINKWNHKNPPIDGFPEASVQGQTDYMTMVIKMIAELGNNGIGVCYWEGAWNAVANAYKNGSLDEEVLTQSKILWEKYGSGWATSYANSYDNNDVGSWFGGSSVDNQTFFDADGKVLDSINVFKYVRTGAIE